MKTKLHISLVQFDIHWEDRASNLEFLDELLNNIQTDLVILPEMFTTGFSMNPEQFAEEAYGPTYRWMKAKAQSGNFAICGSIPTKIDNRFYNRMYFVTPETDFHYDKKHLFGYGSETGIYSPGDEIINAEWQGWKFRLIVCYDLRFPIWCRNNDDYDVLICPASWPEVRNRAWESLLQARAIENMAYSVGVNRTGVDGYNLIYYGNSAVFDPIGERQTLETLKSSILQTTISKETLGNYRNKYRFLEDQDGFEMVKK